MSGEEEVILGYSSSANVTFRGTLATGVEKARWAVMSEEERDQVIEECLFELVQVWVEE